MSHLAAIPHGQANSTLNLKQTSREFQDHQSSSPPEPAAPFYWRLVYEILLGEPDRQEAEGVEECEETERNERQYQSQMTYKLQKILQTQRAREIQRTPRL